MNADRYHQSGRDAPPHAGQDAGYRLKISRPTSAAHFNLYPEKRTRVGRIRQTTAFGLSPLGGCFINY